MLAYVFWHRPRADSTLAAYEQAEIAFHHSLARSRPAGLRGTALFRVAELPWLPPEPGTARAVPGGHDASHASDERSGYEDWYLVEDYTALGVLNAAAVGHGHRTVHDDIARRFGAGAGGLYGLIEGELGPGMDSIGADAVAVWVARSPGTQRRGLAALLGDGMQPGHASLWRRQLVFGPAPEFCLLAAASPPGVAPTRLPDGWSARALVRELLWHG